jgi:DNA-binding NtrC family response regulator
MLNRDNCAKVMVVDNENDIAVVIKKALEIEGGFDVDDFTNPKEALDHFKNNVHKYKIVLSDLRMPHIGGLELAKEIRKLNQKVCILLMSAFEMDQQDLVSEFRATKIDGFIQKPVSMKNLVVLMTQFVVSSSHDTTTSSSSSSSKQQY